MTRLVLRRLGQSAIGTALLLSAGAPADALTTVTTTFNVNSNIVSACSLTATDLNFGAYSPIAITVNAISTVITVNCTSGTPFTLALNAGTGTGSTFVTRHLANGGNTMNYNLYTTVGATTVWGDGTGATATVTGTGTGLLTPTLKTVYGQIPISQDLPAGNYTSVITVSLTF